MPMHFRAYVFTLGLGWVLVLSAEDVQSARIINRTAGLSIDVARRSR